MFEYTDKKRIYWLINQYLENKITQCNFADEYYKSYCLETDLNTLTDKETKVFDELAEVATRFTDIEEDLKNYPGVYYTPQELDQKIMQTRKALEDEWIILESKLH